MMTEFSFFALIFSFNMFVVQHLSHVFIHHSHEQIYLLLEPAGLRFSVCALLPKWHNLSQHQCHAKVVTEQQLSSHWFTARAASILVDFPNNLKEGDPWPRPSESYTFKASECRQVILVLLNETHSKVIYSTHLSLTRSPICTINPVNSEVSL